MVQSLLFVCLLGSPTLASAEDLASVHIVSGKEKILIGDPFQVEINIQHRSGDSYQLKLDPRGLGFFELRGQPTVRTRAIDGQSAETQIELTLVPFLTGKLPIPPFILLHAAGDGQLRTPALEVNVEPLSTPQDQQIKDVRPLPSAPVDGWLQPVALTILLASAGLYWLLRVLDAHVTGWLLALTGLLAARRTSEPAVPIAPRLTLEDEAIAKLRLLLASGLARADIKRFHIQLAEIMTSYAIARYGRQGQEYTTTELFALFEVKGVPKLVTSAFEQILGACDLVKFARWQPEASEAERAAHQAMDLLKVLNFSVPVKGSQQ